MQLKKCRNGGILIVMNLVGLQTTAVKKFKFKCDLNAIINHKRLVVESMAIIFSWANKLFKVLYSKVESNCTLPFIIKELKSIINYTKVDLAQGTTKFNCVFIQNLPDALNILLTIFNDCLSIGMFLEIRSNYLITFIPKTNINKARLITPASFFLKIFEKKIKIDFLSSLKI